MCGTYQWVSSLAAGSVSLMSPLPPPLLPSLRCWLEGCIALRRGPPHLPPCPCSQEASAALRSQPRSPLWVPQQWKVGAPSRAHGPDCSRWFLGSVQPQQGLERSGGNKGTAELRQMVQPPPHLSIYLSFDLINLAALSCNSIYGNQWGSQWTPQWAHSGPLSGVQNIPGMATSGPSFACLHSLDLDHSSHPSSCSRKS